MNLGLSPRLRFAPIWPLLAAIGVAAPVLWFVATGPLEEGSATLLLDTVQILSPQVARVALQSPAEVQSSIRQLGDASSIRFTLIEESGRVMADSSLSWEQVQAMEDHGTRPEIRGALIDGQGIAIRRSATTGQTYAYAATAVTDVEGRRYVLRLARPLEQVQLLQRNLAWTLLLALVCAMVVLAPLSWWLNRELFKPLRDIIAGAGKLAKGDFSVRVAVPRAEELGTLAGTLNQLADEVQARIAQLARERNDLREILANLSEGVLVTDGEGRVRRANKVFARLFDLQGELIGRSIAELVPLPILQELLVGAFRDRELRWGELELDHPDRRILALLVSPLPDEPGALIAVRDVTESSRLAEIRRDLVANVSHEIKTPLTAIRGYAETLEDGALQDIGVASGFVGSILEQCTRLEALLRDLLTLSWLESRREPHAGERVDLEKLANRCLEVLAPQCRSREIEIALHTRGTMPRIEGDPEELDRLLFNLVENAVKYNRPGGQVEVRLEAEGAEVVIEVRDTGIGIPGDALDRIFERFYRVDRGRSRDEGGTGLGLSIVKHAAHAHGGRVEAESRLGVGSVFRVRLPVQSSHGRQEMGKKWGQVQFLSPIQK